MYIPLNLLLAHPDCLRPPPAHCRKAQSPCLGSPHKCCCGRQGAIALWQQSHASRCCDRRCHSPHPAHCRKAQSHSLIPLTSVVAGNKTGLTTRKNTNPVVGNFTVAHLTGSVFTYQYPVFCIRLKFWDSSIRAFARSLTPIPTSLSAIIHPLITALRGFVNPDTTVPIKCSSCRHAQHHPI
jgi:hypothetical protein